MSTVAPSKTNDESAEQAAIRCYLQTVIAVVDCLAQTCPEVGMTFKRRWARAPQRIGFEPTPKALQASSQQLAGDLQAFASYAGAYFRPGVPMIESIAAGGADVADGLLRGVGTQSVMLETLAEALDTIAEMDAPPAAREALEHQSAGLRNCARRAENELLPLVSRLRSLVRDCEDLVSQSRQLYLVDAESGLLNAEGFALELERRRADTSLSCLVRLQIVATREKGQPCSDAEFRHLLDSLAPAVFEQFRSSESIGAWDRQILVIFGGTMEQAQGRQGEIGRRLSGQYHAGETRFKVDVTVDVLAPEQVDALMIAV